MNRLLPILLLVVCCLSLLPATGCSHLQARGLMATAIDAHAAAAAELLPAATAGTTRVDVAITTIVDNGQIFRSYADAKTTNLFAYWFGGKKLYVDATYARALDTMALLAEECARRAPIEPVEWLHQTLARECMALIKVQKAKDGKK